MQKTRSDYKICPYCGASLDVGEACDCRQEKHAPERPKNGLNRSRAYKYTTQGKRRLKRKIKANISEVTSA